MEESDLQIALICAKQEVELAKQVISIYKIMLDDCYKLIRMKDAEIKRLNGEQKKDNVDFEFFKIINDSFPKDNGPYPNGDNA